MIMEIYKLHKICLMILGNSISKFRLIDICYWLLSYIMCFNLFNSHINMPNYMVYFNKFQMRFCGSHKIDHGIIF